jgi:hypothetical protein
VQLAGISSVTTTPPAPPGITTEILVDPNPYGVSNTSSRRLLYVRFRENKLTFTNTIVAATRYLSNQANTIVTHFWGTTLQCPNLFSASGSSSRIFDDSATGESVSQMGQR